MRQQLIQYIDLLFAGAPGAEEIKQEILQNTLDRYDDLISQGKTPEAAYSLAISGIGDINEILGQTAEEHKAQAPTPTPAPEPAQKNKTSRDARISRAAAIAFFILCPIPVLILQNTLGVCLLLAMVATAVALLVFYGKDSSTPTNTPEHYSAFHRVLHGVVWACGLAVYFLFSFLTEAWYISWLIFPITGFVCSLISACFDLNKVFLSALVRIVIFGILILGLTVCLLGGYLGVNTVSFISERYDQIDGTLSSAGTVSAEEIKDIEIQWVSGSITIQRGQTDTIQFSETGGLSEDDKMVWKQSGDRLIIQFCKPHFSLFTNVVTPSKDLLITVPEDWSCDELDLDSVSARINVKQLNVREADLVNVSGQCSFTDCTVGDFSAETVSGKVQYTGILNSLDFNTVSANCTAQLSNSPSEIELESVSGDLTLILPESCGFTLNLDSVSGDFSSDYPTTTSNDRHSYGDGSCHISADSVSGDVKIKAPQ